MLDREIRLACPQPEKTADVPAACEARIESKGVINQRDHGIDVFAEHGERHCGVGQDARVVPRHLDRTPSEVDPPRPDRFPIRGVEVYSQMLAALCRKPKRGAVMRVAGDGLLKQRQRGTQLKGPVHRISTQIEVVGAEIAGPTARRAGGLGGLQRWLDDPGDARRHLVLQIEDNLERTVEVVGPEMGAGFGVK